MCLYSHRYPGMIYKKLIKGVTKELGQYQLGSWRTGWKMGKYFLYYLIFEPYRYPKSVSCCLKKQASYNCDGIIGVCICPSASNCTQYA